MEFIRRSLVVLIVLLLSAPLFAQGSNPFVEVILSTDQAQKGDTVYADVVIRNGHAVGAADIGITVGDCLRVVERLPGNYLPAADENVAYSPFQELTDSGTRFAVAVFDRTRIVNGDGTFYRAVMEVTCDQAVPEVKVTYADVITVVEPDSESNDIIEYSLQDGSVTAGSDVLTVQPGAAVATPAPMINVSTPAIASSLSANTILIAALVVMALCVVGIVALLLVYRRQRVAR